MSDIQYDSSNRSQQENLPQSLRRIAVGLTGLHKRLFSDVRKILGGKYNSPLFDSLAAVLTTLLPAAGAQSKTSSPGITGEVTSPPTVGANQKCTIQSSGSIAVDTAEANNTAVNLSAGPALVNRGTISAKSVLNSPAPVSASDRCTAVFAIAARSFNSPGKFLTWASVRLCPHWLSSQFFVSPAARVASFGSQLPRLGHSLSDAGRFRFLCALALLLGALSAFATAQAAAQAKTPAAPTDLTATACPVCLDLSWTAPSGTVTGYDIHYTTTAESSVTNDAAVLTGQSANAANGWLALGFPNRQRSATDTSTSQRISASAKVVTRVRVRAKNGSVVGAWAFISGTAVRQGPPTNLRVTAGNGQLTLTWTKPAGDLDPYELDYTSAPKSGSGAVGDTDAQIGSDDTKAWIVAASEPAKDATSYTITGLTNGRTYRVRLLATNKYSAPSVDGYAFATGTPQAPSVSLSVSPNSVTEGSPVTVTATLSRTQSTSTTIPLTLTNGSAETTDYGSLASITIAANALSNTDQITTTQDTDLDDETFTVALGTLPSGFAKGSPASIGVTILDDDRSVSLSVSPNPVTEGSSVTVKATLSKPRSSATVIPLTLTRGTAEDGDYGTLASITIAANAMSGTGQITTAQDTGANDETFTVALGALPSGTVGGSPASIGVTILDDDAPPRVVLSVSPNPVTEGSPVRVTATLTRAQSSATFIPLTLTRGTAEDSDYGTLASITIAANALSNTGQITTAQDTDANDETFTVALGDLPSGIDKWTTPASIEVTIRDGDKAPMAPTDLVVTPGDERLGLSWKQPADERDGVAPVSSYDVEYSSASSSAAAQDSNASGEDGSSVWTNAGYVGSEHTHMITNLVNNTLYRVRVRADNGKGKSEWLHGEGMPSATSDSEEDSEEATMVEQSPPGDSEDAPGDSEDAVVLKQSLEALTGSIMGSAVSTVSARVESSDQPSPPLAGDADGGSALLHTLSSLFGLPQPGVPSDGLEEAGHDRLQAHRAHRDEVISPAGRGPGAARYASDQLRLNSFSFSLDEPSDAGASGSGGALVLWGSGDHRSFSGSDHDSFDDELSYSGSWTSLYLGMDQGFSEGGLAGLALSSRRGKVDYRYGADDSRNERYEARLKAVYPYFSATVADGTRLWAMVGLGRGDISNYRETEEAPDTGDLRLGLAAAGMRHELSDWPMARLSAVGDAAHARLKVVSSTRSLAGLQGKVNRLRAGLEVSGKQAAAVPYLRLSARYERGETSRKKGLEAEGGVRWSAERYRAEFHARTLRLRGDSKALRESGAGASVSFSPQSDGTGASLRLSHDWGRPGASGALWQDNPLSLSDAQSGSDQDSARSLNAELGYGLYSERLLGLVTPKLGWREDSAGEQRLGIGAAYRTNSWLGHQLGVEFGIHRRSMHRGVADYGGDLNASMRW